MLESPQKSLYKIKRYAIITKITQNNPQKPCPSKLKLESKAERSKFDVIISLINPKSIKNQQPSKAKE